MFLKGKKKAKVRRGDLDLTFHSTDRLQANDEDSEGEAPPAKKPAKKRARKDDDADEDAEAKAPAKKPKGKKTAKAKTTKTVMCRHRERPGRVRRPRTRRMPTK